MKRIAILLLLVTAALLLVFSLPILAQDVETTEEPTEEATEEVVYDPEVCFAAVPIPLVSAIPSSGMRGVPRCCKWHRHLPKPKKLHR
jgi:hypothetical protein